MSANVFLEPASPVSVRTNVRDFEAYVPGLSIDEIREKYHLDNVVKLASNENPLGTSPLVQQALRRHAAGVFRYPQGGNPRLVRALAKHHKLDPSCVVVCNGSDELIDLLIRVRAEPHVHNIAAFRPCFSIYAVQAQLCDVEFRQADLETNFHFNWPALRALVDENTRLVFITTPDNPSAYCPPVEEVADFARSLPPSCLLVIDEAYMDFTIDESRYSLLPQLAEFPNIMIMRTFSKSFGLAGLRLGYGLMAPELASYIMRVRLPFSVNILAEEAGLAALQDTVFYQETLRIVREERAILTAGLQKLGCTVYPSHTNFIMFEPPRRPACANALELAEKLLQRGFIVRSLKSYHLPQCIRVSIGNPEENNGFLKAMMPILNQNPA